MIKVSYCVAYDWQLLYHAIPPIYNSADVICLSIDKNRRSWSGRFFSWDENGFRKLVQDLDHLGKIILYEDEFYNDLLHPMQNEVAQRNKIAAFLGLDGWHVQLDADEYFFNFDGFVAFLKSYKPSRKVNVCCAMVNLYKFIPEGVLWIKPTSFKNIEFVPVASIMPSYEYGRKNGYFNILTAFSLLHQSWARQEHDIAEKLNNWGHARDFNVQKYFELWQHAGIDNFRSYKDFHHLHPHTWPALDLQPGTTVKALMQLGSACFQLPITDWNLNTANSIWLSRMRKLLKAAGI